MAGLARRENEAVDCGPEDLDPGKVLLFYRVAGPDPVEPKLFRGTGAVTCYFGSGSTAPEPKLSF